MSPTLSRNLSADVVDFLLSNYYAKYPGMQSDVIATREQIEQTFLNHPDKFVIEFDNGNIAGVAAFLTLGDESYDRLDVLDISKVEVLAELMKEHGDNIHFVLLATSGARMIRQGMRHVIENKNPKTISWWNPELNKLHKFKVRSQ